MWHQSETHYELWMNFTPADEILSREVGRDNIVCRVGGSPGCPSLIISVVHR